MHGGVAYARGARRRNPRAPHRRASHEDEKGVDEKIIAVPVDRLHPFYKRVGSYRDLPEITIEQIVHFFEHYKDLEKGQMVEADAMGRSERGDGPYPRGDRAGKARRLSWGTFS